MSSGHSSAPAVGGKLQRLMQKIWWFHSFFALSFGVGVMAFARKGLAHADKVLIALAASWILVFVAFRFIVGPANRKPDEHVVKKGVRFVTNYVIKQMYQQMFFFLVPLYAASAMWSLSSPNWWIVPLLLLCAVLSTMDLVFDNFIMEHKNIAAGMYGLCMFSVLNLMLPLVFHWAHFASLMTAAAITPVMVALLSYPVATVFKGRGLILVVSCTAGLLVGCYFGRVFVPPAPMGMEAGGIGHGTPGSYECVPGPVSEMKADALDGLRCVTKIVEPGGLNDKVVHIWVHNGKTLAKVSPAKMPECKGEVLRSELAPQSMPEDVSGKWQCRIETVDGQMVGLLSFKVPKKTALSEPPKADAGPVDGGPVDAGTAKPSIDAAPLQQRDASPAKEDAGKVERNADANPGDAQ